MLSPREAVVTPPFPHIACCIDDSRASEEALARALALRDATGADLTLVHAGPFPLLVDEVDGVQVVRREDLNADARAWLERRGREVPGAATAFLEGLAGPAICEWAGENDVDLLVTGAGHGRLEGLLLGSVSRHVVDHAPCPVLVVRRGSPRRAAPRRAVRVRDVMSARPIVVGDRDADVRQLMELGDVHHVPVVEGGRLVGLWVASDEGPLVMLGPDSVHEMTPGEDAGEAMRALVGGAEAVVVWDSGVPAGVLTRTDLLQVVRSAMSRGVGRRHPRPLVVRLTGAAGCGKTTLLVRTLALLGRLDVGVVQGNAQESGDVGELRGAAALDEPSAHWRAGLSRAVERLAGAQLILVEDRDGPLEPGRGAGEDLQVAVVAAGDLGGVHAESLEETAALVVTQADSQSAEAVADLLHVLCERRPGLHVFVTAAGHDDRGLGAWARWLEGQALRRRG
jgi:nucleotide-binding universal stress UspA family protein